MKNRIMKCRTCRKEIKTKLEREGNKNIFSRVTSEDGVFFDDGKCWFCNDCWSEVSK